MIHICGLRKNFGQLEVLKGIDLHVGPGEVAAIVGPSGTGKSTLLRCINYLETPTAGSVQVDGVSVSSGKHSKKEIYELRRKSTMIFQNFNLFSNKTVLENIMLAPVVVQKKEKPVAKEQAERILEQIGLADKWNVNPSTLSGGQQQRVAIGRALAVGAKVMLFDEPTSALDPCLVGEVLSLIRRLASEHNTTMLIVTHEMSFARDVAHRIIYMDDGKIVESAPPEEFFTQPKEEKTIQFLQYYQK